ncbi:amidase family protein [Sediminimonas sp.]|uniref:amidase family protein n=1 Tax=Sediminimonas sp. TaxID=2823379 RepID=UPI0025EF4F31|nr:amidase family protein [Sediminimonas sp.]
MNDLWSLTATEVADLVRRGDVRAREVTESTLARIDAENPGCNAIVARCDDAALATADAVDQALAHGLDPGPMAGVPVTIKANTDQAGHATTNGLRLQRDLIATEDSPVVSNLRRAGAVIVGRTNTPAFSLRWFTRNSLHGHTTNPRAPGVTPGGSSGGAGAAVAAGMGPVAQGTDIAGSIRYPAYACGIHGLRPSLGRVPAFNSSGPDRHIGAQLMAVSGPLARSIADLRLSLAAMAQPDLRDPWYTPAPMQGPTLPRRAALCLCPDGMRVAAPVKDALRGAAKRLSDAGWQVDEVDTPPLHEAMRLQLIMWLSEMRHSAGQAVRDEDDPDATAVYTYLQAITPEADLHAVMNALQSRSRLIRGWRAFLSDYPVMLCPVSGELPFDDLRDVVSQSEFEAIVAAQALQIGLPFLNLPGLSVSTGTARGRPVGVQLVANQFREDILLDAGALIAGTVPPT